jgi:protein involved in polysaccharide export with SLBB domain
MAAALATASIVSYAQDITGRTDGFDQPVTRLGAPATQEGSVPPRRVNITNSPAPVSANAPAVEDRDAAADQDRAPERGANAAGGTRRQQSVPRRAADAPTSEFQKFLFDSTGKILPVFGSEFFANAPTSFAPISGAPVPADYPLGTGDELTIRGWGSIDIDYRATIDRNGLISIPTIGSVVLAGVKAGDAEAAIRSAVAKLYKGVTINVSFGKLRAITVYVVGQAKRPGTYTVSSLSTLVTTLFASGGPNSNGSMRRLQVKRAGKVVAELDLYAFIAKGDKSADIKLQDGDSIYIPSAIGFVALTGKVNSPAIYELRSNGDTVESMLDFAGGLPVVADPRRAFLERIDPAQNQPRSVEQFALDAEGLKKPMKSGDVLNVTSITPDFSNAVVLRGNVDQAVRAPYKTGMRVSDLIPSREYLISRSSTQRQNNAVNSADRAKGDGDNETTIASRIGGLIDEINWNYAVVERVNRKDLSVSLIPFNLGKVFDEPAGADNVQLRPGDTVTVFSQADVLVPMERRRVFVRVEGEVNVPGVYQMNAGDTVQSLVARAGGPTQNAYLFGVGFYREQVRKEQEANLEKAASRLENQLRSEQAKAMSNLRGVDAAEAQLAAARGEAERLAISKAVARVRELKPTGRIAFGLDPHQRSFASLPQLKLQNGDRLVVPARPEFVHVFGAVNSESSPLWRPNARVNDYIKMAGASVDADIENVFILRVDGSVLARDSGRWYSGFGSTEVMPGDSIVIPEKLDKETAWTKFTRGTKEWAQIFANFGLGAAAVKTLRN